MALSLRTPVITRPAPRSLLLAGLLAGLGGATSVQADTLLIEGVSAAQSTAAERPARGSSMGTVEARFGAPASRSGAVGKPPITRWDYSDFVVFFEYDHVLHTVRR